MLTLGVGGGGAVRSPDVYLGESGAVVSVAPLTPVSCLAALDELAFEQMGFSSFFRAPPQALAAMEFKAKGREGAAGCGLPLPLGGTGLIVDLGYSATCAYPVLNWRPSTGSTRRLDIGGKFLNNALKETLSYRQFNLMEDTAVVEGVKDSLCFVAQDFPLELGVARRLASVPGALTKTFPQALGAGIGLRYQHVLSNPLSHAPRSNPHDGTGLGIRREYVLPDYINVLQGYVKGSERDPHRSSYAPTPIETLPQSLVETNSTVSLLNGATMDIEKSQIKVGKEGMSQSTLNGRKLNRADGVKRKAKHEKDGGKKKKGKRGKGGRDDEGGEEEEEEEEEDEEGEESDDSDDEEDEEEDEEEGDGGEFKGGKKVRAEVATIAPRKTSARASKSGVSALTSQLRHDGMLAIGEEDEEGGGEREDSRARRHVSNDTKQQQAVGGTVDNSQVLIMGTERISIPELLFRPSDTGLNQGGLPSLVASTIANCPAVYRPALWSSIVLTGGGARIPGLEARLARELRELAPCDTSVLLYTPREPHLTAWRGGSALGSSRATFQRIAITKAMWAEEGAARCAAKMEAAWETMLL